MRIIIFVSLIALLYSCSSDRKQLQTVHTDISHVEPIFIDVEKGNYICLDTVYDSVDLVKLETTRDNVIGEVSQILFVDSLIVVLDAEKSKSITVYDMQGHYKYSIGKIGTGPGEYVEVFHISLIPNKRLIAAVDKRALKIHYYDYSGKWIKSEMTPAFMYYFEYLQSGDKVCDASGCDKSVLGEFQQNTVIVADSNSRIKYGTCQDYYDEQRMTYATAFCIRKFADEVYALPSFTDTIWNITEHKAVAQYKVDIVKNGLPSLDKTVTTSQMKEYLSEHFFLNGDYMVLKDYILLNIWMPNSSWTPLVIYSPGTSRTYLADSYAKRPLTYPLYRIAPIARYGDNIAVVSISPSSLFAMKELFEQKGDKKEVKRIFDNLTEDDNPILFFYHLKQNM